MIKNPRKIFRIVFYTCGMLVSIVYYFVQSTEIDLFLCLPVSLFSTAAAASYLEQRPAGSAFMTWLVYNLCATLTFFCMSTSASLLPAFWLYWLPISIVLFLVPLVSARKMLKE